MFLGIGSNVVCFVVIRVNAGRYVLTDTYRNMQQWIDRCPGVIKSVGFVPRGRSERAIFWPFTFKFTDDMYDIKETPGYKNKLIFIDCQWLVKTDDATFIFIEKLGNTFLPGQFWPCLSFSDLRHGPKSWFLVLCTKAQASLLLWYELCGDGGR